VAILADRRPHPLTEREEALLCTYANQAALAMEHLRLMEERRQKLAQTEQLYDYVSSVSANLVPDAILDKTMASARQILQAEGALATVSAETSRQQRLAMTQGFRCAGDDDIAFPDDGIIGIVAARRTAVASTDLRADGRGHLLWQLTGEAGFASSLTVPMMTSARGPLTGTLTVFSQAMREFTAGDEQLLQTIAAQAATAMQNAHLLLQEKQRARELNRMIRQLTRQAPAGILEMSRDVLAIARQEEDAALTTAELRLACLQEMLQGLCEDVPESLNVKAAFQRLAAAYLERPAEGAPRVSIRVQGAALCLPWRSAMLLGLLVQEWLRVAECAAPPAVDLHGDIKLQLAREKVLVQLDLELATPWQHPPAISAALFAYIQHTLDGTLQQSLADNTHRLCYQFHIPRGE